MAPMTLTTRLDPDCSKSKRDRLVAGYARHRPGLIATKAQVYTWTQFFP